MGSFFMPGFYVVKLTFDICEQAGGVWETKDEVGKSGALLCSPTDKR